MNLHPDVWLALAHQRHDDLVSQARLSRLAAEAHTAWRQSRAHRGNGRPAGNSAGNSAGGARRAQAVPHPAC